MLSFFPGRAVGVARGLGDVGHGCVWVQAIRRRWARRWEQSVALDQLLEGKSALRRADAVTMPRVTAPMTKNQLSGI